MAFFKLGLYILVAAFAFHLFPNPVNCDDDNSKILLHDINTYRKLMNLPVLEESEKASCLADEIANNDLEDKSCEDFRDYYPIPAANNPKIPKFQKNVMTCKINISTTTDGVIIPVCISNFNTDALIFNFNKSNEFLKYLNNSKYTIAGIGSDLDNWMVLIIGTNKTSGNFSAATSLLFHKGYYCMAFFLSVIIVLFN